MDRSEPPRDAATQDATGRRAPRPRFAALLSPNRDINYLAIHAALYTLAFGIAGTFWSVFLLRAGVAPARIFLAAAGILALRFLLRPFVLLTLPLLGPRRTLILGCALSAMQFPSLAFVHGTDRALLFSCVVTAVGNVYYWTCYHAFFAALGDAEKRGNQLGARQALSALTSILGPAIGGIALARFGPWVAFGASALIEICAAWPLLGVAEPSFLRVAPRDAYRAARTGILLFASDGWIMSCTSIAWDVLAFRALGGRFDNFGWLVSGAAFAGACGGLTWGRLIDAGHTRRAVGVNVLVFAATVLFKAASVGNPVLVVAAATVAALLGGLYIPSLMTAVYNEAKASPCPLRFHFAAEGGWDAGGTLACLVAAALATMGAPLQAVILLALPGIAMQARWLTRSYAAQRRARLGAPA